MRKNLSSTRTAVLAATAALTLGLSACGSNDPSTVTRPGTGSSTAGEEISAEHNDADITFINDMSPHHKAALAMAELADDRAENDDVKALAARIVDAQDPELERMKEMAEAWDVELAADGGHSMGGGGGTEMDADAAMLEPLSGAEFDRKFLELMTAHHEGALPMAQAELDSGKNPQAKQLAQEILDTQTAEIEEMTTLVSQL